MIQGLLLCLRKCLEVGFTSRLGEFVSGESQQDLASPVQNRICLASSVMDSRGPELLDSGMHFS
ncbi:uncharacterized protein RAG0_11663 [Rhynchosporium agropyri]|uniref:Uncharacterized protein n=2 Tax=Rhynchosporium TaxID=38037 RepID=A0A1E1L587_9HELO|nr:uncharacterized protein RCO7_14507 [Rhynchosporium commune]CZT05675.1 uncharacterized protein RAG0_11663 [Rhynchosporium agropyri]